MIKCILYDLDGVLVDATEWHYESLNYALKDVAGFIIKRDEHISTFNGIPTIKNWKFYTIKVDWKNLCLIKCGKKNKRKLSK